MPPINLHPINFIIISGVLQSIILSGVLLLTKKGNRYANRLLSIFILISSLHFSYTLIIDTNADNYYPNIFWFPYSFLLAMGPLLFLYTRSLTIPNFRISSKHLIHFLPVALEVSAQLFFINSSIRYDILIYETDGFMIFRAIDCATAVISILYYGKQSLSLIQGHEAWLIQNFSNSKDITLSWLNSLIKYLRILWICWLAYEISFILFWQFQAHLIPIYMLLYALLGISAYSIYWIGFQALTKSEGITEYKTTTSPPPNPNVYSRLTETEIKTTADHLEELMTTEKLYLHDTLTLRTLSARLQKDPNLVSYILNHHFQKSFHDYINQYRVNAVIQKIQDPKHAHLKIVELAYNCGFNSKATFNRVFKHFTGKSPSAYRFPPKP